MGIDQKIDLKDIRSEILQIKTAPLSEHSVRFASINHELAKKLQEIESN